MVTSKRGRKMFSSIFPKLGSSFFNLNMSLGEREICDEGGPNSPLDLSETSPGPFLRQCKSPFKHPG